MIQSTKHAGDGQSERQRGPTIYRSMGPHVADFHSFFSSSLFSPFFTVLFLPARQTSLACQLNAAPLYALSANLPNSFLKTTDAHIAIPMNGKDTTYASPGAAKSFTMGGAF